MTQLDQVTQQNAALVEESAAAAESLKHQAAALAEVVSVFKLAPGTGSAPAADIAANVSRVALRAKAFATPRPAAAFQRLAPTL